MIVKLPSEHNLEFLSLKGGCRGSYQSAHVKMPHCWKSHALDQILMPYIDLATHKALMNAGAIIGAIIHALKLRDHLLVQTHNHTITCTCIE